MEFLAIFNDRQGLWDDRAVIELKDRHGPKGVAPQKLRAPLFPSQEVDRAQRNLQPFLGQVDAYFATVR
jgi:hypothetical protein